MRAVGIAPAEPPTSNMSALDQPRYKENPINLFFESYIRDVIGFLSEERSEGIQGMNLQKVFNTKSQDWRQVIRDVLHLSDTVDIAIQDLWYRNREHFRDDAGRPDPIWFSQVFADKYMEDDSKVDVWPPGALEAAKERIRIGRKWTSGNRTAPLVRAPEVGSRGRCRVWWMGVRQSEPEATQGEGNMFGSVYLYALFRGWIMRRDDGVRAAGIQSGQRPPVSGK